MTLFCRSKKIKTYLFACVVVTGLGHADLIQAKLQYQIAEVGDLGGFYSQGFALNDSGQVTGIAGSPHDGWEGHAFISNSDGKSTDLGTLRRDFFPRNGSNNDSGGTLLGGRSINASGQVAGTYMAEDGYYRGFLSHVNGSLTDLGSLGGKHSFANGINDAGQVAGSAQAADGHIKAYITSPSGELTALSGLGDGTYSSGLGINAAGRVTGFTRISNGFGNDVFHAFVTNPSGQMTDVGTLGGNDSYGIGINDAGLITGASTTAEGSSHAFVTNKKGDMIDLDVLGEKYSSTGVDINNAGQVVGSFQERLLVFEYGRWGEIIGAYYKAGRDKGFVTENGMMVDLNTLLVASATGWRLEVATDINERGQITGWGVNPKGETRAFLLTPVGVPLLPAAWFFGVGLVGLLGRYRGGLKKIFIQI